MWCSKCFRILLFPIIISSISVCIYVCHQINIERNDDEIDHNENHLHWIDLGEKELNEAIEVMNSINTNIAKNIILFIGDGMSLTCLLYTSDAADE